MNETDKEPSDEIPRELARSTGDSRPTVSADQEAWICARIATALKMARAVQQQHRVRADDYTRDSALEGIVNGVCIEVLYTLGLKPAYVNLRRPRD